MQEQAAGRPFRLLIWSWPSERTVRGIRADVLEKADFSDAQSYYLARFLADVRPDVPVSLIGYSLGARRRPARWICSAAARSRIAACRRRSWPGRPHETAGRTASCWWPRPTTPIGCCPAIATARRSALVERMLVTTNACDRVLRRYPRLYGRGGPEAMGCGGPYCDPQPGSCDKIEEIDVACSVGRPHDWYRYAEAPELVERLGWYTFLEPRRRPVLN